MIARRWGGWLGVALLSVTLMACASGGSSIPDSQPLPEGQDFEGVWYSKQFEHMHLKQKGNEVRGIFTYERGGRIQGTAEGNILRFKWVEPGDKEKAIREQSGLGYFQLVVEDGKAVLEGEWGYNEDRTGAGPWNAEYIRKLEPGDPMTLEALRKANR